MKMKIFPVVLAAAITTFSCQKNTPATGGGNNNGGNGGNGGNNKGVTIASISPLHPYPDDEITLNGTGFNADATKDTVEFGHLVGSAFGAWHDGNPDEYASLVQIKSASATQLVIKAVNPFPLDFNSFITAGTPSIAVVRVKAGGTSAVISIPFKRLLLIGWDKTFNNLSSIPRPDDSLQIGGKGFSKHATVTVGGVAIENVSVDSLADNATIGFHLPRTLFGNVLDETLQAMKTVRVTNPDGKWEEKDFGFYLSPLMHIDDMHAENKTYSKAGLGGSGGVIKIFVKGRCLKEDAILKVVSNTGMNTQSSLGISGLQDSTSIEFTPGALNTGSYTISILRGSVVYGACGFTLTN
jgi:hypothetical protein